MRRLVIAVLFSLALFAWPQNGVQSSPAPLADWNQESSSHGPKIVLIIRHAEKPQEPDKESKKEKDPDLSPRGRQRAKALAHVIPDRFPIPDFLFATARSPHSNRPIETITPLSETLREKIDDKFEDDDVAELAHKILKSSKYEGKVVLIAWHHGKIPELAHALGAGDAPDKWAADTFDRVWEITFDNGRATFQDLPQKALPGDSDK